MKCQGKFIFKTLTLRNGGTFKNDKGEEVQYPSAYILKVDEPMENGDINERKFKIAQDKTLLVNSLKTLEAYQKIIIDFKVSLFTAKVGLEIVDVSINDSYDIDE